MVRVDAIVQCAMASTRTIVHGPFEIYIGGRNSHLVRPATTHVIRLRRYAFARAGAQFLSGARHKDGSRIAVSAAIFRARSFDNDDVADF